MARFDSAEYRDYARARALTTEAYDLHLAAMRPFTRGLDHHRSLDVGAGTGRFARVLRDLGLEYFGVEPSIQMRAGHPEPGRVVVARAERLPFQASSFDVCFMSMVIHHLNLREAFAEVKRVCAHDGVVVIRNHFRGRLDGIPLYHWFPEAHDVDAARLPAVEDVVAEFHDVFTKIELIPLRLPIATSLADYLDRISLRAASAFEDLDESAIVAGLARLGLAAAQEDAASPVHASVDVLILRK